MLQHNASIMCLTSHPRHFWKVLLLLPFTVSHPVSSEDVIRLPLRRHSRSRSSRKVELANISHHESKLQDEHAANNGKLDLAMPAMMLDSFLVGLHNIQDQFYTIDVQIGVPPQPARLIVDTGSGDLWVKQTAYDFMKSQSSRLHPLRPIFIQYGQGMLRGVQVQDNVCIGPLCSAHQYFILATSISGIANGQYYDGVIGFGPPKLFMEPKGKPMISDLSEDSHLDAFAFCLAPLNQQSFVSFGTISNLETEARELGFSEKNSLPVVTLNGAFMYWMIAAMVWTGDDVLAGSRIQGLGVSGIFDSGTSLLAVPQNLYLQIIQSIIGLDGVQLCSSGICACSIGINPIHFEFQTFENNKLRITLTKDDLFRRIGVNENNEPMCKLNVMSAGMIPFWIFGDVVLRKTYAIHDIKNRRVILLTKEKAPTNSQELPSLLRLNVLELIVAFSLVSAGAWLGVALIRGQGGCRKKVQGICHARSDMWDDTYCHLAA